MRITRIEIAGEAPERFATLQRRHGSDELAIEIIQPTGTEKFALRIGHVDLWEWAKLLQRRLDGRRGCGGDIREYRDLLEQIGL